MADEHGESIRLNRDDLHRLCAAASLVNPEAESSLAAVHLDGGIVFGGTTHRAAVGRTNAEASEVTLALEAEPLLQLADHDTVREAYLGWDETTARLALDDGSVVVTARVTCEPIGSRGPEALLEKLPHRVEASYAEMRELSEHLASVAWGRDGDGTSAVAALIILPGGQIAAQVFHMSMVSYMMSGMLGCVNEEGAERHMLLNRGYLRECLAALPRESERVVIEFGGPLHALCFATPYCPDLAVLMMPMHPTVLTPHERRTWTDLLARQSDATPPEAETEA